MRAKVLVSGTIGAAMLAMPALVWANTRAEVPTAVAAEVTRAKTRPEVPDTISANLAAPSPRAGTADPVATEEGVRKSKKVKRRFGFFPMSFTALWAATFGSAAADTFLSSYDSRGAA